jgi:hypothetical protein
MTDWIQNPHVRSAFNSFFAAGDIIEPNSSSYSGHHLVQGTKHIDRAVQRAGTSHYGKPKPYESITPEEHSGTALSLEKTADSLARAVKEHPIPEDLPELHGHVSNIRLMAAKYHQANIGGTHSERIKAQLNDL